MLLMPWKSWKQISKELTKDRILKAANGLGFGVLSASTMGYMSVALTGKWHLLIWPIAMSVAGGIIALVSGILWWKQSCAASQK